MRRVQGRNDRARGDACLESVVRPHRGGDVSPIPWGGPPSPIRALVAMGSLRPSSLNLWSGSDFVDAQISGDRSRHRRSVWGQRPRAARWPSDGWHWGVEDYYGDGTNVWD